MFHRILIATLLSVWAVSAQAQEPGGSGIETVIQGQIDAFRQDDFASAFDFASPVIRRLFGNSTTFGQMVREGFPMVWRPADVEFLDLQEQAGRSLQNVMIRDAKGVFHVLEYEMIRVGDGWQINGVRLIEPPAVGV